MILNWYLESYRWKISIHSFQPFSIKEAAMDVLRGLAMNWIMPFTSGDLIARLTGKENKRLVGIAIALNRAIMLFITCVFGCYGVISFADTSSHRPFLGIFLLILTSIVFFILIRNYSLKKFQFPLLERNRVMVIIGISILRYAIFTLQFFIILKVFLPDLSNQILLSGLGWMFFFKSVIPSLFGGLGLREASAMIFFEKFVPNMSHVLFPIFLMWMINNALPSFLGALLVWKLKLKIAG
ncbi:MAG: hypothetical protein AAGA66_07040 [Bacteroidota bacterium]